MKIHFSSDLSKLSESMCKRLNVYAAAAGAACASMLTATQPASAQVVYTPADVILEPGTSYGLDVDHNGTTDFMFNDRGISGIYGVISVNPFPSAHLFACPHCNAVVVGSTPGNTYQPLALNRGSRIGETQRFGDPVSSAVECMAVTLVDGSPGESCNFVNVTNRYLGFRFYPDGEPHYGWARFTVRVKPNLEIKAQLTGYAYESKANTPIRAGQTSGEADDASPDTEPAEPEIILDPHSGQGPISQRLQPASLGLLAVGAQGVRFWRRPDARQ